MSVSELDCEVELEENPRGCQQFIPNQFRPEMCCDCRCRWTQHRGVISQEDYARCIGLKPISGTELTEAQRSMPSAPGVSRMRGSSKDSAIVQKIRVLGQQNFSSGIPPGMRISPSLNTRASPSISGRIGSSLLFDASPNRGPDINSSWALLANNRLDQAIDDAFISSSTPQGPEAKHLSEVGQAIILSTACNQNLVELEKFCSDARSHQDEAEQYQRALQQKYKSYVEMMHNESAELEQEMRKKGTYHSPVADALNESLSDTINGLQRAEVNAALELDRGYQAASNQESSASTALRELKDCLSEHKPDAARLARCDLQLEKLRSEAVKSRIDDAVDAASAEMATMDDIATNLYDQKLRQELLEQLRRQDESIDIPGTSPILPKVWPHPQDFILSPAKTDSHSQSSILSTSNISENDWFSSAPHKKDGNNPGKSHERSHDSSGSSPVIPSQFATVAKECTAERAASSPSQMQGSPLKSHRSSKGPLIKDLVDFNLCNRAWVPGSPANDQSFGSALVRESSSPNTGSSSSHHNSSECMATTNGPSKNRSSCRMDEDSPERVQARFEKLTRDNDSISVILDSSASASMANNVVGTISNALTTPDNEGSCKKVPEDYDATEVDGQLSVTDSRSEKQGHSAMSSVFWRFALALALKIWIAFDVRQKLQRMLPRPLRVFIDNLVCVGGLTAVVHIATRYMCCLLLRRSVPSLKARVNSSECLVANEVAHKALLNVEAMRTSQVVASAATEAQCQQMRHHIAYKIMHNATTQALCSVCSTIQKRDEETQSILVAELLFKHRQRAERAEEALREDRQILAFQTSEVSVLSATLESSQAELRKERAKRAKLEDATHCTIGDELGAPHWTIPQDNVQDAAWPARHSISPIPQRLSMSPVSHGGDSNAGTPSQSAVLQKYDLETPGSHRSGLDQSGLSGPGAAGDYTQWPKWKSRYLKAQKELKAERERSRNLESALENAPGHANPRQRIHGVTALKQENALLRDELQKQKRKQAHRFCHAEENRPPPIAEQENGLQGESKTKFVGVVSWNDGQVAWKRHDRHPMRQVTCNARFGLR